VATKKIDNIQVIQHGEQIVIPESISLRDAATAIARQADYDEEFIRPSIKINGFLPEAAWMTHETLREKYGFIMSNKDPMGRGIQSVNIPTGIGTSVQLPWGEFVCPGFPDGKLTFGSAYDQVAQQLVFVLGGFIQRKYEKRLIEVADLVRKNLRERGYLKGKAWGIRFHDATGEAVAMPEPRFIDTSSVENLVFSEDCRERIDVNIFAFIEMTEKMRVAKIPMKRGVLLHGDYGTGKTMIMRKTAQMAVNNGWTFISCDDPRELADVIKLARNYQPCVVSMEDMDRVTSGDRSIELDNILNTIDGIEAKGTEIMVVATTNFLDHINKATLRPGRLDAMIHVAPPDAIAAIGLLRQYGAAMIDPEADLTDTGRLLAGNKAATIREVAERAKARAIRSGDDTFISVTSLTKTAAEVLDEEKLRMVTEPDKRSDVEKAMSLLADALKEAGVNVTLPTIIGAASGAAVHSETVE
jgi:transitional endoplasmic reticulum ATPase